MYGGITSITHMLVVLYLILKILQSQNDEYYLVFAQQWAPQYCYDNPAPNCLTRNQNVTIHGLWPFAYQGSNPHYCSMKPLVESDIDDLIYSLNQCWPSFSRSGGSNFAFWQHEWDKHGTCWDKIGLKMPHDYFSISIGYNAGYNIENALKSCNIIPGSTEYSRDYVLDCLKNTFGKLCGIGCDKDKYIIEFATCYNWNGIAMDCPYSFNWGCGDKLILYDGGYVQNKTKTFTHDAIDFYY